MAPFAHRLRAAVRAADTPLVVGIDPRPELYPPALVRDSLREARDATDALLRPARRLAHTLIELAAAERLPAVKPNVAFFEALGPPGLSLFAELLRTARSAGLLVIADVKRADIGSTSEAYARAYFGPEAPFRADAITVSPYLGADALAPLLAAALEDDAGLFCLVRTSNPGAAELQDRTLADGRTVHEAVADLVNRLDAESRPPEDRYGPVGAVVGATVPDTVARLRARLPHSFLLAPGVGSQGASVALLRPAFDEHGEGALVPVSRSIAGAWRDMPPSVAFEDAVRARIRALRGELRHVLGR